MKTNGDFLKYWSTAVHIAHASSANAQSKSEAVKNVSDDGGPLAKRRKTKSSTFPGETEKVTFPAIFLTATHRETAEESTAEDNQNYLEVNEKYIQETFSGSASQCHFVDIPCQYRETTGYAFQFFAVENKTSGTDGEDPMATEIRRSVEEMTLSYWKKREAQPARWLKFEDALGELKGITGRPVAGRDYVKEVAKVCQIHSEDDLEEVLRHLTDVASAFYFPEVNALKKCVIHDVSWLTHVLSSFVGSSHLRPPPNLKQHRDEAYSQGLLSEDMVKFLLESAKIEEVHFDIAKAILHHFDAVTPHEDKLFCPFFLESDFDGKTDYGQAFSFPQKASLPLPLVIYPKGVHSFPEPLFLRLVTRLFQHVQRYPDYLMNLSSDQKRNRFICYGVGIQAEFLYHCTRQDSNLESFVSVTVSPIDEEKHRLMSKEELSEVPKLCNALRIFLVENVNDAKKRGMAGFQCDFCCQVKEGKVSADHLADLENFDVSCRVWPKKGRKGAVGREELKRMKLWFGQDEPNSPGGDLDEKITDDEVIEVADRIQGFWKRIAKRLGPNPKFKPHELHVFMQRDNDRDCAEAMLESWREKNHLRATRRELIKALTEENYNALIDDLFGCRANVE